VRIARGKAPSAPPPWALLSYLLRYPTPDVAAARPELAAEVAALPPGEVRAALERFLAGWTGDQTALAARYARRSTCAGAPASS
jgi:nitrate reductase assembly molybdenum cofactor insertion protein NarJ